MSQFFTLKTVWHARKLPHIIIRHHLACSKFVWCLAHLFYPNLNYFLYLALSVRAATINSKSLFLFSLLLSLLFLLPRPFLSLSFCLSLLPLISSPGSSYTALPGSTHHSFTKIHCVSWHFSFLCSDYQKLKNNLKTPDLVWKTHKQLLSI